MAARKKPELTRRPPTPDELSHLQRVPGKARQWRDPRTGRTFSNRQRQTALQGGVSIETYSKIRKTNPRVAEAIRATRERRGDGWRYVPGASGSNSPEYLAERYAAKKGITTAQALRDPKFLQAVETLIDSKSTDTAPQGKRARALARLGLRGWKDKHRVGTSPKRKNQPHIVRGFRL